MRRNYWSRRGSTLSVLALACSVGASTLAQDGTKPVTEKWRPKDGLYGLDDGTAFVEPCNNFPLHYVELGKKLIAANEMYKCKVTRLTDIAPGILRLNENCDTEDGKFKDVATLRKIDEKSFFMLRSGKGQPQWRFVYCREHEEGSDLKSETRDPAEAIRKAVEEQARLATWLPRDGVYASPGTDFDDRCIKSGDAVIGLAAASISRDGSNCRVSYLTNKPPDAVGLNVICDHKPDAPSLVMRNGNLEPSGSETLIVSKIDDQTVSFQKSRYGVFSEPAQQLSYCPEAVQRSYAGSKKAK